MPSLYRPDTWWPTLQHSRRVYFDAWDVSVIIDAALAAWYVVLCIRRIRRLSGLDHWALAPLGASVVAAAWPLIARVPLHLIVGVRADALSVTVSNALLMLVPITLVAGLVRTDLARTSVADAVTQLASRPDSDIAQALREALRDPSLRVLFRVPGSRELVDGAGRPGAAPGVERLVVPLRTVDGDELGVVDLDAALVRHPELVESATSAATLALENARLQATLRNQLEQLRRSRRRIAEATVQERRRLERDLHDGAQQRLLALNLALAEMRVSGVPAEQVIDRVRSEVRLASDELRQLARGIHPAILAQSGLRMAIQDIAERLPFLVDLDITTERFPAAIETTAYFVVCEALTNVLKHAAAEHAIVSVYRHGERIAVEVTDDGRGGALPGTGTGLTGLTDRVRALGGELTVHSPRALGTAVHAELPCG